MIYIKNICVWNKNCCDEVNRVMCAQCPSEFPVNRVMCAHCPSEFPVDRVTCAQCPSEFPVDRVMCAQCQSEFPVDRVMCAQCPSEFPVDKVKCPQCPEFPIDSVTCTYVRPNSQLAPFSMTLAAQHCILKVSKPLWPFVICCTWFIAWARGIMFVCACVRAW